MQQHMKKTAMSSVDHLIPLSLLRSNVFACTCCACIYACACAYVCEGERLRERERKSIVIAQ